MDADIYRNSGNGNFPVLSYTFFSSPCQSDIKSCLPAPLSIIGIQQHNRHAYLSANNTNLSISGLIVDKGKSCWLNLMSQLFCMFCMFSCLNDFMCLRENGPVSTLHFVFLNLLLKIVSSSICLYRLIQSLSYALHLFLPLLFLLPTLSFLFSFFLISHFHFTCFMSHISFL